MMQGKRRGLHQNERTPWAEQSLRVFLGRRDVTRGVEHVASDHEIV